MIVSCFCAYNGPSVQRSDGAPICPRCARPLYDFRDAWIRQSVPPRIEAELRALLGADPDEAPIRGFDNSGGNG